MEIESKHTRAFWLAFVPLFVLSSFIPVLPLCMGTDPDEPILICMLPIWAVYVSVIAMPEWVLFSCPVVVTHVSLSYLIAKRLATFRAQQVRFSILSLLSASAVFSVGISLVIEHSHVGFSVFFFLCLAILIVANLLKLETIGGIPVPEMNRTILISCIVICTTVTWLGLPILIAEIAG